MARLYRPHVPLSVRCQVAERQMEQAVSSLPTNGFGVIYRDLPEKSYRMRDRLDAVLLHLAVILGCEVSELRLDHDPPLAARTQATARIKGIAPIIYFPDANDPDHLFYRPHGPAHERSHLIKTNVRGDHGQHPDRVLIKKARKLERRNDPAKKSRDLAKRRGPKIQSRGFAKVKRPFPRRRKP